MRPGTGSSSREASALGLPMPVAMREVVARLIIEMAQRGIGDQKELANGALRFLAANYRLERKRRQGPSGMAVAPLALPEITAADSGKGLLVP